MEHLQGSGKSTQWWLISEAALALQVPDQGVTGSQPSVLALTVPVPTFKTTQGQTLKGLAVTSPQFSVHSSHSLKLVCGQYFD